MQLILIVLHFKRSLLLFALPTFATQFVVFLSAFYFAQFSPVFSINLVCNKSPKTETEAELELQLELCCYLDLFMYNSTRPVSDKWIKITFQIYLMQTNKTCSLLLGNVHKFT